MGMRIHGIKYLGYTGYILTYIKRKKIWMDRGRGIGTDTSVPIHSPLAGIKEKKFLYPNMGEVYIV